jgi:subtilisin family serine protease
MLIRSGRLLLTAILIPAVIGMTSPAVSHSFAAEAGGPRTEDQGIRMQGDRISIDVHNAAIGDVLRQIAQKSGIAIAVGDGISGEISIKLTDVSIQDALESLCRNRALVYEYLPETKTYRIIRALAVGSTDGKNSSSASVSATGNEDSSTTHSGEGAAKQATQATPDASSDRADEKPGSRVSPGETDTHGRPLYKKDELLVRFKPDATGTQIEELNRSLQSTVLGEISKIRLQRVKLREGLAEQEAAALYKTSAIVEAVERHALRYTNKIANDTYVGRQWGLTTIKAPETWNITTGKPAVVIGVIDTGVDYQHPDLQDNIWTNTKESNGVTGTDDDKDGYTDDIRGWDFVGVTDTADQGSAVADNDPMDVDGHGTHISGIIAAVANNSMGIAGVNWRARIMPLKIAADNSESLEEFAALEALQYAIDHGAKIINCSFGGSTYSTEEYAAFTALKDAGILAVCAAGNDATNNDNSNTTTYPASYDLDNIISVAASASDDSLASFSSWGSNYGKTSVHLMAPGVDVYSTIPGSSALIKVTGTSYTALGMEYAGRTDETGITGILYSCGQGYPSEFPAGVSGNIALIQRGVLDFSVKVQNAEDAGAKGVIIYNNVSNVRGDSFDNNGGTLASPGDWVPAVSVTKARGAALIALGTPTVTLLNKPLYEEMSGTSMATPHVTGAAGLLLSQCPSLTYTEIKSALLNSVDKIAGVKDKLVSGGRLNVYAALKSLLKPGDLNGDCRIGLDDAVLALQVLSRQSPTIPALSFSWGDVDGDDRISLTEAIFILQTVAGLR